MRNLKLVTGALILSTLSAFASEKCGGDCSGGGSSLQGKLLDDKVRSNTAELSTGTPEFEKVMQLNNILVERLPLFGMRFAEFHFGGGKRIRFVLVDQLPEIKASDTRHEVADKLVAFQRGPIVWTLRDFYENASAEEKTTFRIHEFLVREKMKVSPLTSRDRDEVVNMAAMFSDFLHGQYDIKSFPEANELRDTLKANHFETGASKKEYEEALALFEKVEKALNKACDEKSPDPAAFNEITRILRYLKNSPNNGTSEELQKMYLEIWSHVKNNTGGDFSREKLCTLHLEGQEDTELLESLDLRPLEARALWQRELLDGILEMVEKG